MFSPSNNPLAKRFDGEIQDFLFDCQARNLSPKTAHCYQQTLTAWHDFLRALAVMTTEDVAGAHVRRHLTAVMASALV